MPWEHTFLKSVAPLRVKPLTLAVLVLLYIRLTLAVLDHTHSLFSVVWTKRGEVSFVGKKSDSCLVSLSEDSSCQVYCKDTFQSFKPAGLVSLFCGFHLRTVILISWVFSSCQMLTFVSTIPQLFFAFCHHFFVVVCARQPDFKSLCSSPRQNKLNWGGFMFSELQWAGWFKVSVEIIITSVSHHQQSFHLRGVNKMLHKTVVSSHTKTMPALKTVLLQEDEPCQRAVMTVKTTGETTPQPNLTIHKHNFIYLTLFKDKKCFTGIKQKIPEQLHS